MAAALKRENLDRTAAQVTRIMLAQAGWAPSERTVQRHFERLELDRARRPAAGVRPVRSLPAQRVLDRRRPARPGDRRAQDLPVRVPRRPLPAVMVARFGFAEDTVRLAAALRPALASRGVPSRSTSTTAARSSTRGCCGPAPASVSSSCTRRPAGRRAGARSKLLPHRPRPVPRRNHRAGRAAFTDLAELNRLFTAWVETVYHPRTTLETGAPPLRRWQDGLPRPAPLPSPARCGRRSSGRSPAPSPRPPPSPCTATPTRSTRC